eukprot:SAG22_NODE_6436_length_855_cov_9.350529_1_plen_219_part_01
MRDYFLLGARAGPFRAPTEEAAFIAGADEPVLVFRPSKGTAFQPLPTPTRRVRLETAGHATELQLLASRSKVEALVVSWGVARGLRLAARVTMTPQLRDGVYSNGTECVTNRTSRGCFLDTDDAGYFDSAKLSALTSQGVDVIVGANSQRTCMAVYSSVSVYTVPTAGRPEGVAMSRGEKGGSETPTQNHQKRQGYPLGKNAKMAKNIKNESPPRAPKT